MRSHTGGVMSIEHEAVYSTSLTEKSTQNPPQRQK